jgi:hypothetical protein
VEPIKRRLYFDSDGFVFFQLDLFGETTIEKDISDFKALSERNRDTFDVLELPFGAYQQDFAECSGYRVNVETKELEFSYPDPNAPQVPPVFQKPLSEQIKEQKQYTQQLNDDLMSLSDYVTTL